LEGFHDVGVPIHYEESPMNIVLRPKRKSILNSKWIYNIKHTTYGSIEKYKAWFVARGFSQKEGVDYEETFSPVARYISIKIVISLT
jgi:hypothetical protein